MKVELCDICINNIKNSNLNGYGDDLTGSNNTTWATYDEMTNKVIVRRFNFDKTDETKPTEFCVKLPDGVKEFQLSKLDAEQMAESIVEKQKEGVNKLGRNYKAIWEEYIIDCNKLLQHDKGTAPAPKFDEQEQAPFTQEQPVYTEFDQQDPPF
jgi:hypothetical protein